MGSEKRELRAGGSAGLRSLGVLGGFGVIPLLSVGSVLLATPALISVGGSEGWAAIAIAQGFGSACALLVTFGWGIVGPTEVARQELAEQRHTYWISCVMRALNFALLAPIATLLLLGVARGDEETMLSAILVLIGCAAQGVGPSWFLVGQARPGLLTMLDSLPRVGAAISGAALVVWWDSLVPYGIAMATVEVGIVIVSWRILARRGRSDLCWRGEVSERYRQQGVLMVSVVFSIGYTRLSVPLVAAVNYEAVAVFAAIDRVLTLARAGMRPFISYFQSWIVGAGEGEWATRARRASIITCIVGIVGGTLIATSLHSWLGMLLFTASLDISAKQALLCGAVVIALAGSYSSSLYFLVPAGEVRAIAVSTICASLLGIPAIALGAGLAGVDGAITGGLFAESLVLFWQIAATRGVLHRREQCADGS